MALEGPGIVTSAPAWTHALLGRAFPSRLESGQVVAERHTPVANLRCSFWGGDNGVFSPVKLAVECKGCWKH